MSKNIKTLAIMVIAITVIAGAFFYLQNYYFTNKVDDKPLENVPVIKRDIEQEIADAFNQGNLDQAITNAESLVKKNKDDLNALLALAASYLKKGSLDFKEEKYGQKGLDIANKILALDPNSKSGYYLKGYAYEIMQKYSEALQAYNKSLKIEETSGVLEQIGHVYDLMGNTKKAKEFYNKAFEKDNNNLTNLINLGRIKLREEKLDDAFIIYEKVINNSNLKSIRERAEVYQALSEIKFQQGDLEESLRYADLSLKTDKDFPLAYVQKAKLLTLNKQLYLEALNLINQALVLNKNQTAALEWQGIIFLEENKYSEAERSFQKAISTIANDITIMNNRKKLFKSRILYQLSLTQSLLNKTQLAYDNLMESMTNMTKQTMSSIITDIKKGKDGPYANLMKNKDFVNLRNSLLN